MTTTPEWALVDGQRMVIGPGGTFFDDMRRALDVAAEYGVYIVPSLWSFDMLRDNPERHPPVHDNYRLLAEDAVLASYIERALEPMVRALNGHPALLAWELFNEPENMTEGWFRKHKVLEPLDVLGQVIEPRDMCQRLVDNGYAGGWPWQWNEHAEPIKECLTSIEKS